MNDALSSEIDRHLNKTEDRTLLILTAHLLVEERLRNILAQVAREPDELRAARLSFNQVLMLCRAVLGRGDEPPWGFMARLNEARNRIVHRLDPGSLDDLLVSVVEKLRHDYAGHLETPITRFTVAIHYACGYLDAIGGSVRLGHAYADAS
jgi:hypothetical protein